MTSFVAWVGIDSRGPASFYLASDSRLTWPSSPSQSMQHWDFGRKVFASQQTPDLFGYVGDVVFPSLILGQITSSIDAAVLFPKETTCDVRFQRIYDSIQISFAGMPVTHRQDFSIVYATREGLSLRTAFHAWVMHWTTKAGWFSERLMMPNESSAIAVLGSGKQHVKRWGSRWDASSQGRTSRAVFSSFCDAVNSGGDVNSGGAVQLVGLYRIGGGRQIGVISNDHASFLGLPLKASNLESCSEHEWRNRLFERTDCSGNRLLDAQRHRAPKGLGIVGSTLTRASGETT